MIPASAGAASSSERKHAADGRGRETSPHTAEPKRRHPHDSASGFTISAPFPVAAIRRQHARRYARPLLLPSRPALQRAVRTSPLFGTWAHLVFRTFGAAGHHCVEPAFE